MRLIPPAIAAPKATAKAAKKSASAKRASEAKAKANLAQLQASAAVVSSQMLQTDRTLHTQGTNITRAKHKVFLLAIGMKDLTVHYVCCGGLFENEIAVDFDGAPTAGEVITVCVLSKDFAVAMQAVADLGVASAVNVEVDSDVLALRFSTTAADYRLYIPTCTIEGVRSGKHFKQHLPATTALCTDTFESYYDPADVDGSNP